MDRSCPAPAAKTGTYPYEMKVGALLRKLEQGTLQVVDEQQREWWQEQQKNLNPD